MLPPILGLLLLGCLTAAGASVGNYFRDFDVTWGKDHARFLQHGQALQLLLDQDSGSCITSKKEYLFGKFDMEIKLVPGHSAGTVATFYVSTPHNGKTLHVAFSPNVATNIGIASVGVLNGRQSLRGEFLPGFRRNVGRRPCKVP
ncbi:hypothetical protein RHSIM_Rhsim01G0006500 [Rhododendron simsii]|uniref:GH16 domain-containing protein n=1 Tax=Rhododendron simsii TaxID=118357 RepID=A0A834HS52_RHOSS|nr:hypothetical protein RHSIM_Rhsim01G0006500 [Rhododendron simsii]